MALDGKLLLRARDRLDEIRRANEEETTRRTQQIYAKLPQIRRIDEEIQKTMLEVIRLTLQRGDITPALKELETRSLDLQMKKGEILAQNGYAVDYLEEVHSCPHCADKGYTPDGAMCACLKRLYDEEQARELSILCKLGEDSFADFKLDYYSDEPDARYGASPRDYLTIAYKTCRAFAESFGSDSPNLIFRGGTGLGKTMLSGCIAKAVAARGFSVVYETAVAAFEAFEAHKFSRDEEAAEREKRILECDLLILDDLGTEMTTSFTQSALYTIVNSRLAANKKTIISTNLSPEEMAQRYTAQIVSRISGEFETLLFVGQDIRVIKKQQRLS